jgi:hypothetical protein
MHELFTLNETLPVDPGTSPFRVRGVIYDRIVDNAKQVAGRFQTFLDEIHDERVRNFAGQQFRFTSSYDALPMGPMQVAICRLQNQDFESATRARAAEGAHTLIPRMFRLILGFSRPRAWALHAPRLMSEYCGFGDIQLQHARDKSAVFSVGPVPRFIAASHANTLIGIFEGSLDVLHARNVASRYFDVREAGARDGHPLLSYQLELNWS